MSRRKVCITGASMKSERSTLNCVFKSSMPACSEVCRLRHFRISP